MQDLWIWLSIAAAACQAVRTAAQKRLNEKVSTLATTYVRSAFGLPILLVYLVAILLLVDPRYPEFSPLFLFHAACGAGAQVIATATLIALFRVRGFAVASILNKVDVVLIAILGSLFFSEDISASGALALLTVLSGIFLLSASPAARKAELVPATASKPAPAVPPVSSNWLAVSCAIFFALSFLFMREATLSVGEGHFLWRGAWAVMVSVVMQAVVLGIWLLWRQPGVFAKLWANRRGAALVGVSSAAGSMAWFSAFALQNASYVRAVAQVEVLFTLLISHLYFKERLTRLQITGTFLTLAGVLMFRLAA